MDEPIEEVPEPVYSTGETKIKATHRLRRENRWEAFKVRRHEIFRGLEGSRIARNEESWRLGLIEFPRLLELEARVEEDDPWAGVEVTVDLVGDILWVYSNLGRKKLKAVDCPTPGAWEMLAWARDRREKFYEQMLPKALAQRDKVGEVEVEDDEGMRLLDELLGEGE